MTSKTFISGTVIDSPWLNDVNSAVYKASSGIPGAVTRTLLNKLAESVSVKDFGAVGDCTNYGTGTDNLAAFNAAIAYCNANGYELYVPPGRYRLSGALVVSNTSQSGSSFQDYRCNIRGEGARSSQLWFDNGLFNGLTVTGGITGTGQVSMQKVSGLSLLKNDRQGGGLTLNAHAHMSAEDVLMLGWEYGLYMTDVQESNFTNIYSIFNNHGAFITGGSFTQPNVLTFNNCTFGNNANYGIEAQNVSCFTFLGGSVESNGSGGAGINKWGCRIIINTTLTEGTSAAVFTGTYFENNVGLVAGVLGAADLYVVNSASDVGITLTACSFQRHSNYALNCVRFDSSGGFKNRLTLIGNGFKGYSDYTASASRRYVAIGSPADTIQVVDLGNIYTNVLEAPNFDYPYVTPQSITNTWCRFDGTLGSPTVIQGQNVASITKNGTGDYTLNFRRALSSANNGYHHSLIGGNGILQVFQENTTGVRIRTVSLAGAPTDFPMSFGVIGGMGY